MKISLTSLPLLLTDFYQIDLSTPVARLLNSLYYLRYITQKLSRYMEGSIDSYGRRDLSQTGITSCESWINNRSTRTGNALVCAICVCYVCMRVRACVYVCCKCTMSPELSADDNNDRLSFVILRLLFTKACYY